MITDGKKWHYHPVKKLFVLLRGITSKHDRDFFQYKDFSFIQYRERKKIKKHHNVCKNHDYRYVEMPNEDNKLLKYNHGEKSMKVSFVI